MGFFFSLYINKRPIAYLDLALKLNLILKLKRNPSLFLSISCIILEKRDSDGNLTLYYQKNTNLDL